MTQPEATVDIATDAAGAPVVDQERDSTTGALPSDPAATAGETKGGSPQQPARQIALLKQKTRKKVTEAQPVFADDIHIGPKNGSIEDLQVQNARTRVRINRLKNGQASGRRVRPDKKGDEERLNLTLKMMLGVRVAVGRQTIAPESEGLVADDFAQEDKYVFPPTGTAGRLATPSHKLNKTFKFRDYAPKAFKNLRKIFGIDEASYMSSVAGNYDYLELITNSKSGSFFFYSHDQKYIIKNMKRAEAKFFRGIIPAYYEHHRKNPNSVLIRFCGMYLVKNHHRKIPFIVMKCIDGPARVRIHTKYDLKGSAVHRTAKDGEKVLKDNNLRKAEGSFRLGSQREAFLKMMRADAEFLCSVNIMDYSMFVSVHDTTRPPERILRRSNAEFFTFADEASNRTIPAFEPIASSGAASTKGVVWDESKDSDSSSETDNMAAAPSSAGATTSQGIKFRRDGGIDSEGDGPPEIYWMGIIDVLQVYTKMKHAETWYKSIGRVRNELSCVEPTLYCERFIDFMAERTR